jgi:hypothetical protein
MTGLRHFAIFGERNSGTNYLEKLIARNIDGFTAVPRNFGWKHGGLDRRWWAPGHKPQPLHDHARQAEDVLFIAIFRSPLHWLLSMHRLPHHAPFHMQLPLSVFLRMEWADYYNEAAPGDDIRPEPDTRFALGRARNLIERFPSIFDLRREKISRFLSMASQLPRVVFVNYESIVAAPDRFLAALAGLVGRPRLPLTGVDETKFGAGPFRPRAGETMAVHDLEYVAGRLSWYHEHLAGYEADFPRLEAALAGPADDIAIDGLIHHHPVLRHAEGGSMSEIGLDAAQSGSRPA